MDSGPLPAARVQVDAVIFDLGRVLVDFDWSYAMQLAERWTGLPPREAETWLKEKASLYEFEVGALKADEFHANIERSLGRRLPFEEFCTLWNSIFTSEIMPTTELLRTLNHAGTVRLGILSNTNSIHAEFLRRQFPLLGELEHVYLSHEIGLRKPDPAAYQYVLERLGVSPQRTAFVDDMPKNVSAAAAMGMHGVLARTPEDVRDGLARLGVGAAGMEERA